jgi:hypothetical protein
MSGYQNTKFRGKDGINPAATTTLFDGYLDVSADNAQNDAMVGKFLANVTASGANSGIIAGVYSKLSVQTASPAGAVGGPATAFYGVLDYSGGANLNSNVVAVMVLDKRGDAANSATAPAAYIAFGEVLFNANSVANPISFLFDVGRNGAYLQANSGVVTTNSVNTSAISGSLKIRVNGVTRYIPTYTGLT